MTPLCTTLIAFHLKMVIERNACFCCCYFCCCCFFSFFFPKNKSTARIYRQFFIDATRLPMKRCIIFLKIFHFCLSFSLTFSVYVSLSIWTDTIVLLVRWHDRLWISFHFISPQFHNLFYPFVGKMCVCVPNVEYYSVFMMIFVFDSLFSPSI